MAARPGRRPGAGGVRADRARGRLGRRRDPDPGRAVDDGRVGRQRREGVHHQLGHRHHLGRDGHRSHRHDDGKAEISRSWCPAARRGSPSSRPTTSSAGTSPTPTGSSFDDCRVPEANLLGARGRRLPAVPRRCSTTAGSPSRRWPSGWPRPAWTCRRDYANDAADLRGADRVAARASRSRSSDLAVAVEAARLLTYKAAWRSKDARAVRPAEVKQAAAIAKLYSTEAAVTRDAGGDPGLRRQRLHGGVPGGAVLP